MGTFAIHAEVFARISNLRVAVAVADGLDNAAPHPAIEALWRATWEHAASASVYGNAQSHPRVKPWRDTFTRMGVSGKQFPSSVEALLRRALKGGEPFIINPLVDLYNAISLTRLVPAGAFDLDDIHDTLELRLSRAGDTFQALDEGEPLAVPEGEVSYATGATIITRHIVWRQSRAGLVTPNTRRAILVSEVLAELGPDAPSEVAGDFAHEPARVLRRAVSDVDSDRRAAVHRVVSRPETPGMGWVTPSHTESRRLLMRRVRFR